MHVCFEGESVVTEKGSCIGALRCIDVTDPGERNTIATCTVNALIMMVYLVDLRINVRLSGLLALNQRVVGSESYCAHQRLQAFCMMWLAAYS